MAAFFNPGEINTGHSIHLAKSHKRQWARMSKADALDILRAYIDDVEHRRNLGHESFHTWPQALKVSVGEKIDFVGSTTNYSKSLKAMLPEMDVNRVTNKHLSSGNKCK